MISREMISKAYIKGHGIEIGAFHNPFPLHNGATVKYLDKLTRPELIAQFPEIKNHQDIPPTDIIGDGSTLETIASQSYDFLLSSHQLEHTESPLNCLENQLRVVKSGGILFYAIPNKDHTFDQPRKVTSFYHLSDDYQADKESKEWKERLVEHVDEYLFSVDKITDNQKRAELARLRVSQGLDVHYHCWDSDGIFEIFARAQDFINQRYTVELFKKADHEVFVVLRKK